MASILLPPSSPEVLQSSETAEAYWHRLAPKKVVKAYARGKSDEAWKIWREHLASRKFPPKSSKLFKSKRSPLLWSLPNEMAEAKPSDLLRLLTSEQAFPSAKNAELESLLTDWVENSQAAQTSLALGLEIVALGYALPALSQSIGTRLWWALLEKLGGMAQDASGLDVEANPLLAIWLGGELPLVLAYHLPELKAMRALWPEGKERISHAVVELLDGEGLSHARHLGLLRPVLACLTRVSLLAEAYKEECFTDEAQSQFEFFIRRALELCAADGSQMMTPGSAGKWEPELFQAMLQVGGKRQDRLAAKASLPCYSADQRKKALSHKLPDCSTSSEWAALALLRAGWARKSARMLVKYDTPQVELELITERGTILSGDWNLELELRGNKIPVAGPWEEVCWQSDHDVAYVELETSLPGGLKIQRQILLAKDEQFLLLADAILGEQQQPIIYRGSVPLAAETSFAPEADTRDGLLIAAKPQATVLPLALPEWRTDPRHGTLVAGNRRLQLEQRAEAKNLFCPLLLDLNPRRLNKKRTWRQLTVAENRVIQAAETCVGYRAQCNDDQWFFYRSLGPKGNRTLLSHNLVSEFLAARFETDGTIEELLEIE